MKIPKWALWVVGLILVASLFGIADPLGLRLKDKVNLNVADASSGSCSFSYDVGVSGAAAGLTLKEESTNHWVGTLTSADLNSANNTALDAGDITVTVLDSCQDSQSDWTERAIDYKTEGFTFHDEVDTSDAANYYTMEYSSSDFYNITVNGQTFATKEPFTTDSIYRGSPGAAAVVPYVEDYTTLDQGIQDNYDTMPVMKINIVDNKGNTAGTYEIVYLKD